MVRHTLKILKHFSARFLKCVFPFWDVMHYKLTGFYMIATSAMKELKGQSCAPVKILNSENFRES